VFLRKCSYVCATVLLAACLARAAEPAGEERVRKIVREEIEKTEKRGTLFQKGVDNFFDRVEFGLSFTGLMQGSVGAEERVSPEEDTSAATGSSDLEFTARFNDVWRGFVHLEAGSGGGLDSELALLVGVNGDADDDENVRLCEAWVEGLWRFGEVHSLLARLGKIDLTAEFDTNEAANDETTQFLGSGFVNNPTFAAADNDFGGILVYTYRDVVSVKVGFCDADEQADRGGRFFDDLCLVGEVGVSVKLFDRPGNYRLYVWYDDTKLEGVDPDTETDSPGAGWGVSCDQGILENLTAFFRFGQADEEYYAVETWVSGGLEFGGALWGREDDAVGLAYGLALLGSDAEDLAEADDRDAAHEHHAELYYRFKLNGNMELTPSAQIVDNPGGDDDNDILAVFGIRLQVNF
jgi:high affinity Mn2+ porin